MNDKNTNIRNYKRLVVTYVLNINEFGLQLIRVKLPFRLDHVNCFLAEGETGWTLIDTGLHNSETKLMWDNIFQDKQIDNIIVTHEHPDHIGSAGYLQQTYDPTIYMTEQAYEFAKHFVATERLVNLQENYEQSAIPKPIIKELIKANKNMIKAVTPLPKVDHFLQDNEKFVIGNNEYEVIFTPGHADGLITLFNKEKSVLIATDHILPKITPNISYWFFGKQNPLKSYIQSLNRIKELDAKVVIPSHGEPFYDANERIDEIITHHDERLEQILNIIKDGRNIYEVTNDMFPKQLTNHELRFAVGEALAHLLYLESEGQCASKKINGQWIYQAI